MATDNDFETLPLHKALRRRLDAVLSVPASEPRGGVSDTLQRAVDTLCAIDLGREWAELFVTLVAHTETGDEQLEQVLELARETRAFIEHFRTDPWLTFARQLCADAFAGGTDASPVEVVRCLRRWVELPDGRRTRQVYEEYEGQCRKSRTSAAEVRHAIAGLIAASADTGRRVLARVLVTTVQTAGEFRVPPSELRSELQQLASVPLDRAAPEHYALDDALLRQFRAQGYSVAYLFALNREHCSPEQPGNGALLRAWLPVLLPGGLTEGKLTGLLLRGGYRPPGTAPRQGEPAPISPRAWENLTQIVGAVEPLARRDQVLELVFGQFRTPAEMEQRIRVIREHVLTWAARPNNRLDALRAAILNLNSRQEGHEAMLAVAGLPSRLSLVDAVAFFRRYLADHPPYSEGSDAAKLYREKTYDVIRRLHNVSHGFSALKVVNQRMPDGGPSAYDEFGDDLFEKLYVVNVSSYDQFPGYGVLFVGAQMQRIFAHDFTHPTDPLHRYRAAWTDPRRLRSTHLDLDRYADAEFAFVRGFLGVSVPEGDFAPRYEVPGAHLTLMIWNNHFPGVEGELAMLVPTSVYRERLRPCVIRCKELDREHPEVLDACRAGLDPNSVRAECIAKSLPFVDLGSPSVSGGGLVNGFRAQHPPYHKWEAKLVQRETHDAAGHVHKSHILGGYRTRLGSDPELDAALQPLRDANDLVFDIASSYLNLLDIFFMSFVTWHRGDTLDAIDFESAFDQNERQQLEETDDEEPFNPRNARILTTAYAYHDQMVARGAKRSEFRVYCTANPLHLYSQPEATITLDTFDMTLRIRGENQREIHFARDRVGSHERAELLWVTHVLAYLRQTGFDMRPYDRAAVAELFPDSGG